MDKMLMVYGPPMQKYTLEKILIAEGFSVFSYSIYKYGREVYMKDTYFDITNLKLINEKSFEGSLEKSVSCIIVAIPATVLEKEIENLLKLNKPLIIISNDYDSKIILPKIWKHKGKVLLLRGLFNKVKENNNDNALRVTVIQAIKFLDRKNTYGVFHSSDLIKQGGFI